MEEKRREINHPNHRHALTLIEDDYHKVDGVFCFGCRQQISGPSYACIPCLFFLHKFCGELPEQMSHPFHPQHSLTLRPYRNPFLCDVCTEHRITYRYQCIPCKFYVDIQCASIVLRIQQPIEHRSHTHKLLHLEQSVMFMCNACNTKHEGRSYLCPECGFWVNQKCANSYPPTVELSEQHHSHPLSLIYSIPYDHWPLCNICSKNVNRNQWAYFCFDCSYIVHINCSPSSRTQHSRDGKEKSKEAEKVDPDLVKLPCADDYADMIAQLIKNINSQKMEVTDVSQAQTINHASHHHPLILSDKQGESCSTSTTAVTVSGGQSDQRQCNGCGQTISQPFYQCIQPECNNFCLHEWCAELPDQLPQHPGHPQHPLVLLNTPRSPDFHPCQCKLCESYCNTFIFGCEECGFYLDVKCACLPGGILHESHKHALTLMQATLPRCSVCHRRISWSIAFVCSGCTHNICIKCTLLPSSVRHKYDKHPFTLTFSFPVMDGTYYCEICEENINSKRWFYHCHTCDQSLHIQCVPRDSHDSMCSSIKYGITFTAPYHPDHPITCVSSLKDDSDNSTCNKCRKSIRDRNENLAFKCADCNFWIHCSCALSLYSIDWRSLLHRPLLGKKAD